MIRQWKGTNWLHCLSSLSLLIGVASIIFAASHLRLAREIKGGTYFSECKIPTWKHLEQMTIQRAAYRGHDYPSTLPIQGPNPPVLLTVEDSVQYPLLGYASDAAWFAMAGSAFGYVRLDDNFWDIDKVPLGKRMFVVTMFHEMHCLRLLNLAFDETKPVGMHHIKHCLGYLRQMALCDADLTLEPADWEERRRSGEREDSQGATHVCRDWEQVALTVEGNWAEWQKTKATSVT